VNRPDIPASRITTGQPSPRPIFAVGMGPHPVDSVLDASRPRRTSRPEGGGGAPRPRRGRLRGVAGEHVTGPVNVASECRSRSETWPGRSTSRSVRQPPSPCRRSIRRSPDPLRAARPTGLLGRGVRSATHSGRVAPASSRPLTLGFRSYRPSRTAYRPSRRAAARTGPSTACRRS